MEGAGLVSLGVLAVVGLALFTVHELDEIVLVRTYLRAAQDVPELRRSMWWRGRALHPSTPTLALIIGEEVVLIAAALVAGIAGNWPGLVVAVVVANSVHLVGHVVDAARTRRWTPGSPTALLTLPLNIGALWWFFSTTPVPLPTVLVWTAAAGAVLIINLQVMLWLVGPRLETWVQRLYRPR